MLYKFVMPILLVAGFALSGCTKDVHGGGVVTLYSVSEGQPGEATIALAFTCKDKKNTISGTLAWNDRANRVNFKARLPETPVSELTEVSTCKEAAAEADGKSASFNMAIINTKGQQTGGVVITVGEPGETPGCGSTSWVSVTTYGDFQYIAFGCLDRGKIVFK